MKRLDSLKIVSLSPRWPHLGASEKQSQKYNELNFQGIMVHWLKKKKNHNYLGIMNKQMIAVQYLIVLFLNVWAQGRGPFKQVSPSLFLWFGFEYYGIKCFKRSCCQVGCSLFLWGAACDELRPAAWIAIILKLVFLWQQRPLRMCACVRAVYRRLQNTPFEDASFNRSLIESLLNRRLFHQKKLPCWNSHRILGHNKRFKKKKDKR